MGFKKIIAEKPDIVMISPVGSYLFTIIPLIILLKLFLNKNHRTKFLLKSDWSLDYTGLSVLKKALSTVLFIMSSYIFDKVLLETYCGLSRANNLPLIRTDRIARIPIGYPSDFIPIHRYDNRKREKIVLCVARIARMKDQLTLVKAFGKASKSYKDWKLVLAGPIEDSDYKRELDEAIRILRLGSSIEFTGFIDENELRMLYESSSIFCLPSRFLENAGQVKYEAIAAGLPVISTDIPCESDNEELGVMVFKAGDFDYLSGILERLMGSEEMRREVSERSQKRLVSYTEIVNELLSLLK
ncbi:MAG: glycosyltransferase family 4 protein [Candidatus Micrarchaeia archaeon]